MIKTNKVPEKMRAVVLTGFGGIDKLQYRDDVAVPKPGRGEVLIRVGACGMNNTDINLRTRWYDREVNESLSEDVGLKGAGDARGDTSTRGTWKEETIVFPRIQGAAVVGTIAGVGVAVAESRIGERVIIDPQVRDLSLPNRAQLVAYLGGERDGGYAEYTVVHDENAHAIQSHLSDAELATFPTSYDTAEEMLVRARLQEGETVIVTGAAGGVGTALVQLSLIRGAKVIAIAGAAKEERLRALGANHFVAREKENVREAIEAIAGDRAIDVIADVVGGPFFTDSLKLLRRGGRYTTAGALAGPIQSIDLRDLIYKDLEMFGITCPTPDTFKAVIDHVVAGRLKPLIERTYQLQEMALAQTELLKRNHVGKLVIVP
ncbi:MULTISPECIES: alcohol dehydrogenase family protein [Rhizobium]|uniref:Alcohol dehydrogenase zinc-binding domain protein n=2 Tax=Rhizobium TaxID=379 RepID=K0Q0Y9_9HYPH|nr:MULTISPECIES: alcohol dehydrogenase family protein [Rhizobium]KWV43436.1 alcohol dehydrogenase [Rhizobium altiplani]CCM80028.1 Alcohol dehydrogenase zinc-binding domain protein [Rhizobium mesoamericanum STM3625]